MRRPDGRRRLCGQSRRPADCRHKAAQSSAAPRESRLSVEFRGSEDSGLRSPGHPAPALVPGHGTHLTQSQTLTLHNTVPSRHVNGQWPIGNRGLGIGASAGPAESGHEGTGPGVSEGSGEGISRSPGTGKSSGQDAGSGKSPRGSSRESPGSGPAFGSAPGTTIGPEASPRKGRCVGPRNGLERGARQRA